MTRSSETTGRPSEANDDRVGQSSTAKALQLAHRITSISLAFVLPILAGFYCDQWLGIRPACMLIGLALGMTVAGLQLMKLVSSLQANNK